MQSNLQEVHPSLHQQHENYSSSTIFLLGIGLMRHLRLQDLHRTFQAVASVHGP